MGLSHKVPAGKVEQHMCIVCVACMARCMQAWWEASPPSKPSLQHTPSVHMTGPPTPVRSVPAGAATW
jgi:hypothetical protein